MTEKALVELRYLAKQSCPLWGGHLKRNTPPNPVLAGYVSDGLIEAVGKEGYRITDRGRCYISNRR
jgi:hypothetical protein